ncbi:MAG: hypothetical protein V2B18_20720 [Pseudomonadota bacterium]
MGKDLERQLLFAEELSELLADLFSRPVYLDFESGDHLVINRVDIVSVSRRSSMQRVEIFRTPHFGIVLALDGWVQLAQSDEHIYHELLIHPAALVHPSLRSALVLGGGDGCAVRELLRYEELEYLDMVEIDAAVIELSREYLHKINRKSLDDPRLHTFINDGEQFLKDNPEKTYDLIIADLTEPYDSAGDFGGLSGHIFSADFYQLLKGHMNPSAILVIQTGGLSFNAYVDKLHCEILEGLQAGFGTVSAAYEYIPSYEQIWSITLASDHPYDFIGFDPDPSMERKGIGPLKYYDRISHTRAFQMPRTVRDLLASRKAE